MSLRITRRVEVFLALTLFAPLALAVNVRGRIDFVYPNGFAPMARAGVQICYIGGNCTPPFVTGQDGMYYFNLPPGLVAVLVNGMERYRIQIMNYPNFDIPPIRGN